MSHPNHHPQYQSDILRPTELHDFGDLFGAPNNSMRAKPVLAVVAVVLMIFGAAHMRAEPTAAAPTVAADSSR